MNTLQKFIYAVCVTCKPNRSRTVRYAFPFFATAIVLLAALAAATGTSNSYISVVSTPQTVKAGDSFTLDVYVNASVPVNAVDISLQYPQSQVKIKGIDTGESVITLWTKDPYVDGNTVVMRGGTFRKGFLGRHLIATINAQATESGVAQFDVTKDILLAGDGSGSKVHTKNSTNAKTKLYIADASGDFSAINDEMPGSLKSNIALHIITDIDGDGKVTLEDVSSFMAAWGSHAKQYDFNGDGRMSFTDFAIILADSFFN